MATEVDLDSRFPDIVVEMERKLDRDEMTCAKRIADAAYANAPRLKRVIITPSFYRTPGWLASTIEVDEIEGETAVAATAFISHFLEFGTENMRARPFLQPAAMVEEPELIGQVTTTLKRL